MSMLHRSGNVGIYYEKHQAQVSSKTPLLMVHGFQDSSGMWSRSIPHLSRDRDVITWDMRGHGRSSYPRDPEEYEEAVAIADVDALLDACESETAVLAGFSLGGYLTLAYNFHRPQRTSAMILIGTGPGFKNPASRERWNDIARAHADDFDARGLCALRGSSAISLAEHRNAKGLAACARGLVVQKDDHVIQSLPRVDVPTCIIVGQQDQPFISGSEYMAMKIPRAELHSVSGAGHAVNVDAPQEFVEIVSTFLSALP